MRGNIDSSVFRFPFGPGHMLRLNSEGLQELPVLKGLVQSGGEIPVPQDPWMKPGSQAVSISAVRGRPFFFGQIIENTG